MRRSHPRSTSRSRSIDGARATTRRPACFRALAVGQHAVVGTTVTYALRPRRARPTNCTRPSSSSSTIAGRTLTGQAEVAPPWRSSPGGAVRARATSRVLAAFNATLPAASTRPGSSSPGRSAGCRPRGRARRRPRTRAGALPPTDRRAKLSLTTSTPASNRRSSMPRRISRQGPAWRRILRTAAAFGLACAPCRTLAQPLHGDRLPHRHRRDPRAARSPQLRGKPGACAGRRPTTPTTCFAVVLDPEVMRCWSRAPMHRTRRAEDSSATCDQAFSKWDLDRWVIVMRDDRVIGTTTLFHFDPPPAAGVGYALRSPTTGDAGSLPKRFRSPSTGRCGRWTCTASGRHRSASDASRALLERLGFCSEATARTAFFVGDDAPPIQVVRRARGVARAARLNDPIDRL